MATNNKSILTGIMLTAGTAVGAGMFSLPVVSSGMWFVLSTVCLLLIWYISYLSAIYLLEVNVRFEPGASFDTLVKNVLGKSWNILAGLSIAFLLFILLYAYFSAFGSIVSTTLNIEKLVNISWSQGLLGFLFGSALATIVWWSTKLVGRISTILVVGMVITFVFSMSGFALQVELTNLFNSTSTNNDYAFYIWAALPYFLTSFGFSSIVPSLYKYYGKNPITIKKSLLFGSLIALLVYCLFIFVVFGNISRESFIDINKAGGNMGILVNALSQSGEHSIVNTALTIFSNFAIITSFLGVGLGLFDYISDLFSLPDTGKGRFRAACITFLPAGILSFIFPDGFIAAIGFAGLVCAFALFFIPFLMVRQVRKNDNEGTYKVGGGNILLGLFAISSIVVALLHILAMLNYLPKW